MPDCLPPSYSPGNKLNTPSHSFERTSSVRISGRRGNKLTDPVEEYRANYRTEALEAHPPIPINGFVNKLLVMRTNDNQLFLEEFGSIEMTPQQPCSVAELPANRSKNRYNNILTYDYSRVKLSHGRGQSDYINASHCSVRGGGRWLLWVQQQQLHVYTTCFTNNTFLVLFMLSFGPSPLPLTGFHEGSGLHSHARSSARHCGRLLAASVGAEQPHNHHAHQRAGEGQGQV